MAALDIHAKSGFDPSLIRSFNIGTRQSKLALVQTEIIIHALKKAFPDRDFQIHARDTAAGDIDKVTPFKDMPVKNIWTHELEQLMLENKLDLLVHSLKGMEGGQDRFDTDHIRCSYTDPSFVCNWWNHDTC